MTLPSIAAAVWATSFCPCSPVPRQLPCAACARRCWASALPARVQRPSQSLPWERDLGQGSPHPAQRVNRERHPCGRTAGTARSIPFCLGKSILCTCSRINVTSRDRSVRVQCLAWPSITDHLGPELRQFSERKLP